MKDGKIDICMLVTNEVTGDPRVRKEANTLALAGYSVVVLGLRTDNKTSLSSVFEPGYTVYRCDVAGITFCIDKITSKLAEKNRSFLIKSIILSFKIIKKIFHLLKLAGLAGKIKSNVYHAHDLDTFPAACWALLRNKGKLVYDSHELWTEQRENFPLLLKKFLSFIEMHFVGKADTVITVNNSIANELTRRYKIIIPHVIRNFSLQKKDISPAPLNGIIKILYHGGYINGRGLEEIIASVRYWDDGVELYLRGYGPIENTLHDMVREYGLSGKVHFMAPVPMDRLIEEACFAHVGILPYKPTCLNNLYSLPNKLFEYMMAGLAVVASDLPEIKRLNDKAGFGILFDPNAPEDIARSVNMLAGDRNLLEECRRNVLEWSRSVGNWENESQKLVDIYSNLLSSK